MERDEGLRLGLVGCGGIGVLRARAAVRAPGVRLTAVQDLDPSRSAAVGRETGAAVVADWRDLVAREDVDAVVVSTPPASHAEICLAAIAAGKHVLCEKPLARDPAECRSIVEAAEAAGVFAATGFNYRFYPSVKKAREIVDSGLIGEIDHIRAYSGYSATDHSHAWLHEHDAMGGGALRDNGIHLIDLTAWFLGDVVEAAGLATGHVWGFEGCEDNGFLLLRNAADRVATLQASWTEWTGYRFQLEVYGTRGCVRFSCFPMLTKVTWFDELGGKSQSKSHYFLTTHLREHLRSYRAIVTDSFVEEFQAFAGAVRGERTAIATAHEGALAVEAAAAASHGPAAGEGENEAVAPVTAVAAAPPEPSSDDDPDAPELSAVITVFAGRRYLVRCLEALAGGAGARTEVIVPADDTLGDTTELERRFLDVRFIPVRGSRTPAELRAVGVGAARAPLVALTEDHCIPAPDWAARIVEAHRSPHAAVGGVVDKVDGERRRDSGLSWAVYLTDWGRYMSPVAEGPAEYLTDCNVSYKRSALEPIRELWQDEFHETTVNWTLADRGETLWLAPSVRVSQQRSLTVAEAFRDRYGFGRLFASTRVAATSFPRRIGYAAGSALLPAVLLARTARTVMRKRRARGDFIRAIPALLFTTSVWSLGEMIGYVTGRAPAGLSPR